MKIKKGDNVIVLTGKDKGKKGKVSRAFPALDKVLVEGINKFKKHQRPKKYKGAHIHISSFTFAMLAFSTVLLAQQVAARL